MIVYDKLWDVLQAQGVSKSKLKTDKIVSGQSYTNLVNGDSMTFKTLDKLCKYLHCQPGDVLEWVPDSEGGSKGNSEGGRIP